MSFIPEFGVQRQADLYEFEASLVYRASARTGPKGTEKLCLKTKTKPEKKTQKTLNKDEAKSEATF